MKNYKLLISAVACGIVMLCSFVASADSDKSGVVTVVRLRGTAEYSLDGGNTWIPVVLGKSLQAGSLLKSDDNSIVDILVGKSIAEEKVELMKYNTRSNPARNIIPQAEKNMIRLRPNTILGIDKLVVPDSDPNVISDAQLDLKKGRIFASVKKVSPSSEYLVKIPNGVAAVRGTQFELSTSDGGSSCAVASGTVWISFTITDKNGNPVLGSDGKPFPAVQVTLNPGQSFNLDQSMLDSLRKKLSQSSTTGTAGTLSDADLQALVTTLTSLATSGITSLDTSEITILENALYGIGNINIGISLVAPGAGTDNGEPIHISTQ
jgi:hypothetical protein